MQHEQDLRKDFCFVLKMIAQWKLDDLIFSHVGLRLENDVILVNPLNRLFSSVQPEELVKVNSQGEVLESKAGLDPTGVKLVGSILSARSDIGCVIHTHSKNAITIGAKSNRLMALCQQALIIGPTNFHPYGDPTIGLDESEKVINSLVGANNLILEHHGLITTGKSLKDTLLRLYFFEYAADLHIRSLSTEGPTKELSPDSAFTPVLDNPHYIDSAWDALKNRFDSLL